MPTETTTQVNQLHCPVVPPVYLELMGSHSQSLCGAAGLLQQDVEGMSKLTRMCTFAREQQLIMIVVD